MQAHASKAFIPTPLYGLTDPRHDFGPRADLNRAQRVGLLSTARRGQDRPTWPVAVAGALTWLLRVPTCSVRWLLVSLSHPPSCTELGGPARVWRREFQRADGGTRRTRAHPGPQGARP